MLLLLVLLLLSAQFYKNYFVLRTRVEWNRLDDIDSPYKYLLLYIYNISLSNHLFVSILGLQQSLLFCVCVLNQTQTVSLFASKSQMTIGQNVICCTFTEVMHFSICLGILVFTVLFKLPVLVSISGTPA